MQREVSSLRLSRLNSYSKIMTDTTISRWDFHYPYDLSEFLHSNNELYIFLI